jgi:uncharacterized protein YehS (DUF1456 family)
LWGQGCPVYNSNLGMRFMVTSELAERPMAARKRGKDSGPKANTVVVKVEAEIIRKARIIASFEGKDLSSFISEALGPVIEKRYREHIRRASDSLDDPEKPKR